MPPELDSTGSSNTDTGHDDSQATAGTDTDATLLTGGDQGGEGSPDGDNTGSDGADGNGEGGSGDESGSLEVPESYEFNMPEGMEMDQVMADAAIPVFKELKLTQDGADKLTGLMVDQAQRQAQASVDAFDAQMKDWREDLKNDPEFGGEKFDENSAEIVKFIDATAGEDVKEGLVNILNTSGAGNNPSMVKYFHSLAKRFPVSEDNPQGGQHGTSRKEGAEGRAERLYGNG